MKEENIVKQELEEAIEFDGVKVKALKFDLEHINRGWDKVANDYNVEVRSFYTADDVVEFFENFSYYSIEWEEGFNKFGVKIKGKKHYRYIAYVLDFNTDEQKKIVIDIPAKFKNEAIIVTIY